MQLKPDSPKILKALAAAMFLVFAAAGLWLLFLAFEIGDVYPPFSSHRAELDGTEVLYEALERLPQLRVGRSYGPAGSMPRPGETTIIVAGLSALDWYLGDEHEMQELVRLAARGGRLVIALQPLAPSAPSLRQKEKERKEEADKEPPQPLGERLLQAGAKFDAQPRSIEVGGRTVKQSFAVLEETGKPLPARLPWRSACHLEPHVDSWKTIYASATLPVILHREHGKGEIVLMADSFLLTNRAMWENRHSDFLSWLVGGRRGVLFYERHLGVAENPGIVWLIKKYNLGGFVAALLVVTALFIWRNSMPLVPGRSTPEESENVRTPGRGSSLLALVARSLPASRVLEVCVDEWKKTERPSHEVSEQVDKLVREKGDIVAVYRQIVKQLRG